MSDIKFKFEELHVYQKALVFIDDVYDVCEDFPKSEQYNLSSQFIRAATSIALNIAEGSSDTSKQFNRYLQIAIDSVNECVVCASIAKRRQYLTPETNSKLREQLAEQSKMITSLKKYLKTKM